jgi:hypothetical protein
VKNVRSPFESRRIAPKDARSGSSGRSPSASGRPDTCSSAPAASVATSWIHISRAKETPDGIEWPVKLFVTATLTVTTLPGGMGGAASIRTDTEFLRRLRIASFCASRSTPRNGS